VSHQLAQAQPCRMPAPSTRPSMRTSSLVASLEQSKVSRILERAAASGWTDIIPMAGGEPRFDLPAGALEVLRESGPDLLTKYSPFMGYADLLELIRVKLDTLNGIQVGADQVICVPGGSSALFCALRALVDEGDEVIVQDPCWEHYPNIVRLVGGVVRRLPMLFDGGRYVPDLDRLKSLVNPRTKAVLLNTPLNPCGAVLTRAEAEGILAITEPAGVAVVCDEEYETFIHGPHEHFSMGAISDTVVTLHSFSKSFAMTGIRLGYVSGPAEVIQLVKRLALYSHMYPPSPSQRMAFGVLSGDYRAYLEGVRAEYTRKMERLRTGLAGIEGVECWRPEGGVYLFPRIDAPGDTPASELLIEQLHVLCVPGEGSGEQGRGHVRLFFGVPDPMLDDASARIASALQLAAAGST
jgi:aspartate aminotransferase